MNSRLVFCCVIGAVLLAIPLPSQAQWGRYGRSGVVQGPDGVLYNTRSPEWRMSGGNIYVYQQLVQQKMLLQQQRLMLRQQRQQQALARQVQQATRKGAESRRASSDRSKWRWRESSTRCGLASATKTENAGRSRVQCSGGWQPEARRAATKSDSATTPKSGTASPSRRTHRALRIEPWPTWRHGDGWTGLNVKSCPSQSISTRSDGLTFCSRTAVASALASRC